jgi:hypothetical protein
MSLQGANGFGNSIIVFLGGTMGGMLHCATTKATIISVVEPGNLDFAFKSLIGGFITLGVKLLGDWIIEFYKNRKDKNNGTD